MGRSVARSPYQTWTFGPRAVMRLFSELFGSEERPDGKQSQCAKEVKRVASMFPKHASVLNVIGRYIESEEAILSAINAETRDKDKAKRLGEKYRETKINLARRDKELAKTEDRIEVLESEIARLQRKVHEAITDREEANRDANNALIEFKHRMEVISDAIYKVSDESFRVENPLAWGQCVDSLWKDLPGALSSVDFNDRIRPLEDEGRVVELNTSDDGEGDYKLISFVGSKRERGEARWSEDRIGFDERPDGFRAFALDGVGGSVHSRHLVRSIAHSLLDSKEVVPVVERELDRFGKSMNSEMVQFDADEKLAVFQKERLNKGSSCVLAVTDYDKRSGTVTVSQVGDTVAFVEIEGGEWKVVPEKFGNGKKFDTSPIQVSTNDLASVRGIETTKIEDATGRVAVATDGVAEFILRSGGIEEFIDQVELYEGDALGLLNKLRKEGIEDDDLSFLLAESSSSC